MLIYKCEIIVKEEVMNVGEWRRTGGVGMGRECVGNEVNPVLMYEILKKKYEKVLKNPECSRKA